MKVYIGQYKNWIGPYQIADKIFFWVRDYRFDDPLEAEQQPWDHRARLRAVRRQSPRRSRARSRDRTPP